MLRIQNLSSNPLQFCIFGASSTCKGNPISKVFCEKYINPKHLSEMAVMKTKFKPKKIFKKKNFSGKYKNGHVNDELDEDENQEIVEIPKETLIVLQELKIARELGGNDATKRHQQVRKLRRWLRLRAESSFPMAEENFMRLWKGLYYCMYMSDKPLVQEQLAENLGQLVECFAGHADLSVKFFSAFLNTMRNEWFGIDQWRMDKFYMLMRRMLRHMLCVLKSVDWQPAAIKLFNEETKKTVLAESGCAMAMTMHYMDIIFEELAKVAQGEISAETVSLFLEPFVDYLLTQNDGKLFTHCRGRIFNHLLFQSALGREYQDKYEAWKLMGFPETIDAVEKVEEEEEAATADDNNKEVEATDGKDNKSPLDPRAGNVDVFVPELPLDGTIVIERLQQVVLKEEMSSKRRKMLKTILNNFETYQSGEFPLGVKSMPHYKDERDTDLPLVDEKVAALEETEQELYGTNRKFKKLNKRQRRKLLQSLDLKNVQAGDFYDIIEKALPTVDKQGRRKELRKTLMNGWLEEEADDLGENIVKNTKRAQLTKKQKFKRNLEKLKARKQMLRGKKTKKNAEEPKVLEEKQMQELSINKIPQLQVEEKNVEKQSAVVESNSWEKPLQEGEVEYFVPSRRLMVKKRNEQMVRTLAKEAPRRYTMDNQLKLASSPRTPGSAKRVKIALKNNTMQKPSDYIKQIKSSPNVPYDSSKKPGKGLLKPHTMPSPVDPFYARRHSLKIKNTSFL